MATKSEVWQPGNMCSTGGGCNGNGTGSLCIYVSSGERDQLEPLLMYPHMKTLCKIRIGVSRNEAFYQSENSLAGCPVLAVLRSRLTYKIQGVCGCEAAQTIPVKGNWNLFLFETSSEQTTFAKSLIHFWRCEREASMLINSRLFFNWENSEKSGKMDYVMGRIEGDSIFAFLTCYLFVEGQEKSGYEWSPHAEQLLCRE